MEKNNSTLQSSNEKNDNNKEIIEEKNVISPTLSPRAKTNEELMTEFLNYKPKSPHKKNINDNNNEIDHISSRKHSISEKKDIDATEIEDKGKQRHTTIQQRFATISHIFSNVFLYFIYML